MLWRAWTFLAGVPLGVLAGLALLEAPSPAKLQLAAIGGGIALAGLGSIAARTRKDDPERGRHLATGACWALFALPASGAVLLGLGPGDGWLLGLGLLAALAGLLSGSRVRGPAGGPGRQIGVVLGVLLASSAIVLGLAALAASLSPALAPPSRERADAVYDLDAKVATLPLPRCRPVVRRVAVLLDRGAHPRLDLAGEYLWFDALTRSGRRQVHRLERESGEVACWTCGEPGHNVRPHPDGLGRHVVFDSDRNASWRNPTDSELYLAPGDGTTPRHPARRLTFHPGPDDHALLHPSGVLVWSRGDRGSFDVVSASIRSGHGSLTLGVPGRLARGGTAWVVPLAWSRDGRSLVLARGQPYRPLHLTVLDPATDERLDLPGGTPPGSAGAFGADGTWMAIATTRRRGLPAFLPEELGFALARIAAWLPPAGPRFRSTQVRMGEVRGEATPIELRELAAWGSPTGIACEPDGTGFILGQRRHGATGVEERLVSATLDCDE